MSKLFWFPNPLTSETKGLFRHDDDGVVRISRPDKHPTGRDGISWDLPDILTDKHGARISIATPDYFEETFRGTLLLHVNDDDPVLKGIAGFLCDDSTSVKKPAPCPEPIPIPPNPNPSDKAIDIINQVYATGKYNLATYDGCGQFTEACCTELHNRNSNLWMHLQKFPPQNHYPDQPYVPNGKVHAVDAIQCLGGSPDTPPAIYDIILDSESPRAKPALNFAGAAVVNLAYYPAK